MRAALLLLPLLTILLALPALAAAPPNVATFSVAAYDPSTGEVGVAVQSKFFAVGSVVPWCKAGVGAVATQAFGQPTYGPRGLELMAGDLSPFSVMQTLLHDDDKAAQRQIGMVGVNSGIIQIDAGALGELAKRGKLDHFDDFPDFVAREPEQRFPPMAATWTGNECLDWAGGIARVAPDGVVYAVQGNILTGPEVVEAMAAFMDAPHDIEVENVVNEPSDECVMEVFKALAADDFAGRLLGALVAGQLAGGDSRGMQSAALKVCQAGAGYGGYTDVKYDLRVDDAVDPFYELARLLNMARPIQLSFEGYRYLEAGDNANAIKVFTTLVETVGDAYAHYNLACALSRDGQLEAAMQHLTVALQQDAALKELAAEDSDLANIRALPEFAPLLAEQEPASDETTQQTDGANS